MDYDVQRFTRHCAASGRGSPGEEFYTALVVDGAEVRRLDFAASVAGAAGACDRLVEVAGAAA